MDKEDTQIIVITKPELRNPEQQILLVALLPFAFLTAQQ
jgi:hypothetical protein